MSWNWYHVISSASVTSRPLREVVSWNACVSFQYKTSVASTSSWGRELKLLVLPTISGSLICRPLREVVSWNIRWVDVLKNGLIVDLFVRSWVEILWEGRTWQNRKSTSSWGRELKCPDDLNEIVKAMSTSSWGRELKWLCRQVDNGDVRRPLREVVSWNVI